VSASLHAGFTELRTGSDVAMELQVKTGQALALMGSSRAGKPITVGAIAWTERITDGCIRWGETVLADARTHCRCTGVPWGCWGKTRGSSPT